MDDTITLKDLSGAVKALMQKHGPEAVVLPADDGTNLLTALSEINTRLSRLEHRGQMHPYAVPSWAKSSYPSSFYSRGVACELCGLTEADGSHSLPVGPQQQQ